MKLEIDLQKELFSFESEQDWINNAQGRYARCGVRRGEYITIDARGRILTKGAEFMRATRDEAYPVVVYDIGAE
jgi:hypothetical protein